MVSWSAWKKRRGRKRKRPSPTLAHAYLRRELPPLAVAARIRRQSPERMSRSLRRSLHAVLAHTDWPPVPGNVPLIAIADAMMVHVEKRIVSLYLIMVRARGSRQALITKPYVAEGKESWSGWQEAFANLSPSVLDAIVALVCDGHRGLSSVAVRRNWHIQLCNFHIIAKIQGRRSRWSQSRHRAEGERLYQSLKVVLTSISETEVSRALAILKDIRTQTHSPQLKRYLSGFVKSHHRYRTYLLYPELNLPRTSNSAEALARIIRTMLGRAHGFRTLPALIRWTHALLQTRKSIACNGFYQQN